MKTDKVRYILEVCEKFKVTDEFNKKFKYNKNNDDRIYFYDDYFQLHIYKGSDYEDEFHDINYSEVKSIEVFD